MFKKLLLLFLIAVCAISFSGCNVIWPEDDDEDESNVYVNGHGNSVYYNSVNLEALNNNTKEEKER